MLSENLLPKSRAYHQIFLDEPDSETSGKEDEPLYGPGFLPRKFKIAIATPQDNTPDVLANDLGVIAIFEGQALIGYNLAVGGGLGMTHNRRDTYPRLASVIGSVGPDELLAATEAVIRFQRDHGDRGDRKRARLKYVLDDRGMEYVRAGIGKAFGRPLTNPLPMPSFQVPDLLGWHEQGDGNSWLGVPVPSGRIEDSAEVMLRTALRRLVAAYDIDPIMTPQQDVLLPGIRPQDRAAVEALLRGHGVRLAGEYSPLGLWALACPALPTCGLALTEAERVRQPIVEGIDAALRRHGLENERISLRITGCPNGCARSYAGDIGLVGRVPGSYAIFVGGDFEGTRLSFKLLERVKLADLGTRLEPLFAAFSTDRRPDEGFGDFCNRLGLDALLGLIAAAEPVAAE